MDTTIEEPQSFSATVIVKGVEANHPVSMQDLGTTVRTIVREHVTRADRGRWFASMEQCWNQEHGSHVILTFTGLSDPLDPQRALIQV